MTVFQDATGQGKGAVDPDPEVREKHANDVRQAISLGSLLGVKRVVTMPGLPASDAAGASR